MTIAPASSDTLTVGMIGYSLMGAAHSHAWRNAHRFFDLPATPVLHTIACRAESAVADAAATYGFACRTTRWQDLVGDPEIDMIDICTPGDTHHEITLAALAAGKHLLCEKPLANSVSESEEMAAAAAQAVRRGIRSICGFSYRRTPALTYARQLISEGFVRRIRQVHAQYLQDWLSDENAPMTWRLDKDKAGSGALGDIGAHVIDLVRWLTGQPIAAVSGTLATVVPTRPAAGTAQGLGGQGDTSGERGQVMVDDVALFNARFDSGVLGSFEATRMAQGRKNAVRVEINGSAGSIAFDFERMNELEIYDATAPAGRQGFTRLLTTDPEHSYAAAWWPTGHGLGYEHTFTHQIADLVRAIGEGTDPSPSFEEALQVQCILAAVEGSSATGSSWTTIDADPTDAQETTPHGRPAPRTALVVRGGWDGHQPIAETDLFIPFLQEHGLAVRIEDSPAIYADAEHPELDDYGDAHIALSSGATGFVRVDWFTPKGLSPWGDGRTFVLGTERYIELRKYVDVTTDNGPNQVILVDEDGEHRLEANDKVGYLFLGELVLDVLNRTENAMTQVHVFKAVELALRARSGPRSSPAAPD